MEGYSLVFSPYLFFPKIRVFCLVFGFFQGRVSSCNAGCPETQICLPLPSQCWIKVNTTSRLILEVLLGYHRPKERTYCHTVSSVFKPSLFCFVDTRKDEILFIFFIIFFLPTVCSDQLLMSVTVWDSMHQIPVTGVRSDCELPSGCWESSAGPLQE